MMMDRWEPIVSWVIYLSINDIEIGKDQIFFTGFIHLKRNIGKCTEINLVSLEICIAYFIFFILVE